MFLLAVIRSLNDDFPHWQQTVSVYLRPEGSGYQIVSIERDSPPPNPSECPDLTVRKGACCAGADIHERRSSRARHTVWNVPAGTVPSATGRDTPPLQGSCQAARAVATKDIRDLRDELS